MMKIYVENEKNIFTSERSNDRIYYENVTIS